MTPNFTLILAGGILFALPVLGYWWWRFGGADTLVFLIVSGLFSALLDLLSTFAARNYEYPRQSVLWVFTFIFFGWIGTCGTCLLLAEGIWMSSGQDMLSHPRAWWQVPLLTSVIAVALDMFVDPIAVQAGYWVWLAPSGVYDGIPLLNFVGWGVLMFLAPLGWLAIARQRAWGDGKKIVVAWGALVPLMLTAVVLSLVLNGALAALGLK
jgi:uncharacterized membrane protein